MASREPSGLFWPTLLTCVGLLVLFGLGTWQLERKVWKDDLLQRIAQGTRAEPMILDAAETLVAGGDNLEYARVRVRGRLHVDRSLYYYAADARGAGWHVYTPLETPSGTIVVVNRGWLSDADRRAGIAERPGQAARDVEIVGLLRRPGEKAFFTPANEAERNVWYWRDLAGMLRSAYPAGVRKAAPFFLDAEATPVAAGDAKGPRGGTTRLALPNRHLEYALTWYGLALTLAGVYGAFVLQRMRTRRRQMFGRRLGLRS